MDVMMPRMDGIQVLQKIRAGGSSVPVLLLTAKAEVDDKVLGLDSGANVMPCMSVNLVMRTPFI